MTQTDYPQLFRRYISRRLVQVRKAAESETFVHAQLQQAQALRALSYALAAPPEDPQAATSLLIALAPLMEQAGHRDSWRACLLQGVKHCQKSGDLAAEAALSFQIGFLFHRQSRFTEAKQWLRMGLRHYEATKNQHGQSKTLHQLAHIACLQHQYDCATALVEQAAPLAGHDLILQAMTYFIKGLLAAGYGRWSEAEELHRSALELRKRSGDQRRIAWSLLDLAGILRHQNRYAEAIQYYEESSTILRSLSDIQSWSHAQMNLGLVYYHSGDPANALGYFHSSVIELRTSNDLLNLARIYTNMGLAFLALTQFGEAEESFATSACTYRCINDKSGELNATDGLAMALLGQCRYADAIAKLEQGLVALHHIKHLPTYGYLLQSMQSHLEEAQRGGRRSA